jgi:hypothetical protein
LPKAFFPKAFATAKGFAKQVLCSIYSFFPKAFFSKERLCEASFMLNLFFLSQGFLF